MFSATRSLLSVRAIFLALVLVFAAMAQSADAKILKMVCDLFDAPSRVDFFAEAPGRFAEKTVEFLAFGDAAMDYYQS